jgi:hypothetical protein
MAGKETHSTHPLIVAAIYSYSWEGQRRVTVRRLPDRRQDLAWDRSHAKGSYGGFKIPMWNLLKTKRYPINNPCHREESSVTSRHICWNDVMVDIQNVMSPESGAGGKENWRKFISGNKTRYLRSRTCMMRGSCEHSPHMVTAPKRGIDIMLITWWTIVRADFELPKHKCIRNTPTKGVDRWSFTWRLGGP